MAQQTLKFCCLSESISSSAMWGHYANNEKGFALEYDCRDLYSSVIKDENHHRLCTCLPVIYGEKRYQVLDDYILYLLKYNLLSNALLRSGYSSCSLMQCIEILSSMPCPDNLVPTKIAVHKSYEWSYEHEWRLFCSSLYDQDFIYSDHGYFLMKPKAVYLGRRISQINEKILRRIADEKQIPVYRMVLDDESFSYDLIAEKN